MFCEKWAIRFKNFLMFYGFTKDSFQKYNAFLSTSLMTWMKAIKYIKQNKIKSRYFPHILVPHLYLRITGCNCYCNLFFTSDVFDELLMI